MRDSMTLNSYLEIKGYKCNTMEKVKREWICIITTGKAKPLDEKELGWYNWLGIAHFSRSTMKHPIKTITDVTKTLHLLNHHMSEKCLVKIVKAI